MGCTRIEPGTPAPPWSGEPVGPGRVSHEAAQVTDSNAVSPELERCQSSTGLEGQERTPSHSVLQMTLKFFW